MNRRQFLQSTGLGVAALVAAPGVSSVLAACDSSGSKNGKLTLDFPTWQAEEPGVKDWWKLAVSTYESQHPDVKINIKQIPFASYTDTLTSRFSAGKPPDIVHLPTTTFGSYASQGWLANLDDRLKSTDVLANWTSIEDTMIWKGHHVGVLVLGYAPVLYYNEKLVGSSSLPTSIDQLVSQAKQLTRNGVYGYAATTTTEANAYGEATWFVYGAGGAWTHGNDLSFTDETVIKAMDQYRESASYAPKGVPGVQKRTLFFDGKMAMMIEGPFVYSALQAANTSSKPYIKVAKAPYVQQPGYPSNSIHIPADIDSVKADAVWDFIKLLTTPDMQTKYAQMYQVSAPRKGAVTEAMVKSSPQLGLFQTVTASSVSATPDNEKVVANFAVVQKLIIDACVRLQTTKDSTSSVMSDLQDKVAKAIKV
jgi:multiple sugar transport system substrate-binding protein